MLHNGAQYSQWPTSGRIGSITPAIWGDPKPSQRGGNINNGPQGGGLATQTLSSGGPPMLRSCGQYQGWPTSGRIGYITPAIWGVPNASQRGTILEVINKWADWLHKP